VQDAQHRLRVDGHFHAGRRFARLARAIDDGGDPPGRAQPPRLVLAPALTLACF
jgi:hypothetical protein